MRDKFDRVFFRSLLPYFFLALMVIAAWKVINEIGYFLGFFHWFWRIITPFFYGFVLAYILSIPCGGMERLLSKTNRAFIEKRKRGFSVLIVYLIFVFIVYSVLNVVIPFIYSSITLFINNIPIYYASTLELFDIINNFELLETYNIKIDPEAIFVSIQDWVRGFGFDDLQIPLNAIMGVTSAMFTTFITVVSSIYILLEKDKFKVFLTKMLKAFTSGKAFDSITNYSGRLNKNFKQYIFTQTIDGCILGTIVTLELAFIIRSPFAPVLGLMLGIVNYIPYFGSIFGTIVAVAVVGFTQGPIMMLIAGIVLLITQQLDGNVIQPKLMGGSFSISPLLIILSVTVGGAVAGVFGMIAAIPIVAVLKDILYNLIEFYERKKIGHHLK
ncbi:MAG: AI-2E family transporter [Defluviitaleaceae bacterium]|nr:AI-2E family transporter [Defluviitaleaceae bacterium]MCL2835760.1 AI-2E family transporter [Defluviitaleaceae bacterium]